MVIKTYAIQTGLCILTVALLAERPVAQCAADYTTANNFCNLDSLYLTAIPVGGTGPYTFLWETDETTQTISIPLANGDYMLTITDANGCVAIINCHIKPSPLVLYYPYNQNACEGDTVTLFLQWFRDSIPGATYLWSTGETTATIQLTDDLTWSVTVTDPATGCEYVIPPGLFDFHPTPYPEIIGPAMLCSGQTATLSVTGGPFGTIIWYEEGVWDGIYSETLDIDGPGTYIVWGGSPEVGYCWHQDTITIVTGNIDPPILQGPPDLCTGQNGTITITNSSAYTNFVWSNGQSGSSISVNQPGTYYVTVANSGGCTSTGAITIGNGSDFNESLSVVASTCGEQNGSIEVEVLPPDAYAFNWSNGSTSEDLTDVPAGSYTVTITSPDGCTEIATAVIPDNPIPITINEIIDPSTSCNSGNGSIDITVLPATATYTYQWSTGATTQDLFNLSPGTYTVTVVLGANCSATESYAIVNNSDSPALDATSVPATCGQNNGAIDLVATGGQGGYVFLWSDGSTTEDLTNITAGNYAVTVTDSNGCTEAISVVVTDNPISFSLIANVLPVTSCTESNGSIDLTVSPGGTYTFLWSNGATTEDISNLPEGIYTVEVLFGIDCIETATYAITHQGNQIALAVEIIPNTSCTSPNGDIDLTVTPAGNYTFLWSNGATTEDLRDLAAGTYDVTVIDSENCSTFGTYVIDDTLPLLTVSALVIPATCGAHNGALDLQVTPASGNVFLWSDGSVTEDISDLAPGAYIVTITHQSGCILTDTFHVQNLNSAFSVAGVHVDNSSCTTGNGSIDISIFPFGLYAFAWSTGDTTEDLQNLGPGSYTVTVTDSMFCASSATFNVANNALHPVLTSSITPSVCGQSNGAIDLIVAPPGSYTFAWSNSITTEDLPAVSPGIYSVTVTNIHGCTTIDTLTVEDSNTPFSLASQVSPDSTCSAPTGTIDLIVTPAGNYTFIWSNGMTSEDLQNLSAGTYVVTVTDDLSCTTMDTILVANAALDPVITSEITPSICLADNGSIDLTLVPSIGNTFIWSNGSTEEDIQGLASGTYSVTVTAGNGCVTSATFEVLNYNTGMTFEEAITHHSSCITATGSIDLTVSPPGAYSFSWSTGDTSEDVTDLLPGVYSVTVTDSLNCTTGGTFVIEDHSVLPLINETIVPAQCGQNNGAIDISVDPPGGVIFAWSTGAATEDIDSLMPGTYAVTVTTSEGCSTVANFTVLNFDTQIHLAATSVANTSCVNPNGAIDLTVLPSGMYDFIWSNGITSEDLHDLGAGIYEVTVTDSAGCSITTILTVLDETSVPVVQYQVSPETCGEGNGSIDLSVHPVAGNIFSWSNGQTQEDIHGLEPGVYGVTVTNEMGCSWTGEFSIAGSQVPVVDLGADLIVEYGQEVTLHAVISIPISALDTVIWLPEELFTCTQQMCLDQTFVPLQRTEVVLMVFDTNGCMAEESVIIDIRSAIDPSVFIPNVFSPNADGSNDVFTVFATSDVQEVVDLRIFDRWGEFVFQNEHFPPNDFDYGWDGIYRSKLMDPQVFVYWTVVKFKDGSELLYKGDVTLIR